MKSDRDTFYRADRYRYEVVWPGVLQARRACASTGGVDARFAVGWANRAPISGRGPTPAARRLRVGSDIGGTFTNSCSWMKESVDF